MGLGGLANLATAARVPLGDRYPPRLPELRPGGHLCWYCGRAGQQRDQRSTGFYQCASCAVQWYGGTEVLPL